MGQKSRSRSSSDEKDSKARSPRRSPKRSGISDMNKSTNAFDLAKQAGLSSDLKRSATTPVESNSNTKTKDSAGKLSESPALKRSATTPVDSGNTKTKNLGAKSSKNTRKSLSPKRDRDKMNISCSALDADMFNNLSETVSQVRTLVGSTEQESASLSYQTNSSSAANKDGSRRRSVGTNGRETKTPDNTTLNNEMAKKMKQYKSRNERLGSSASDLEPPSSDDVCRALEKALQVKIGKTKTKKAPARRRSRSLSDLKRSADSPATPEERMFLRMHMSAMFDDSKEK